MAEENESKQAAGAELDPETITDLEAAEEDTDKIDGGVRKASATCASVACGGLY